VATTQTQQYTSLAFPIHTDANMGGNLIAFTNYVQPTKAQTLLSIGCSRKTQIRDAVYPLIPLQWLG
jgi:hypothetical protein